MAFVGVKVEVTVEASSVEEAEELVVSLLKQNYSVASVEVDKSVLAYEREYRG